MKKVLSVLLGVAVTAGFLMGLTACGKDGHSQYKVTEAQWNAAFDAESYQNEENVTVYLESCVGIDLTFYEYKRKGASYQLGYSNDAEGVAVSYAFDGTYYYYSGNSCYFSSDTKTEVSSQQLALPRLFEGKTESDGTDGGRYYKMVYAMPACKNLYGSFSYNEKTHVYELAEGGASALCGALSAGASDASRVTAQASFRNGKLVQFDCAFLAEAEGYESEYQLVMRVSKTNILSFL